MYANQMLNQVGQNMTGYPQLYQSPYQQQLSNNFSSASQSLTRVNGIDGARAYQMSPNSQAALFDNNEDIMYIKVTDGAGFPTIRSFSFVEVLDEPSKQTLNSEYVSKDEFDSFKKEVTDYVQQFIWKPKSANNSDKSTNNRTGKTDNEQH